MATYVQIDPTQALDPFQGVKKLPLDEFFTSGHRTCQRQGPGEARIVRGRMIWKGPL